MAKIFAITTKDNPYDPFDQFEQWYNFDTVKGYNSAGYLARLARTSDSLSPVENEQEIEAAIDDIIRLDFMDIYRKVTREVSDEEFEEWVSGEPA